MSRIKPFMLRIPHDLWVFLKKSSIENETSMNKIIEDCVRKYKEKSEKRLRKSDTVV